jgi:hypothetical protein
LFGFFFFFFGWVFLKIYLLFFLWAGARARGYITEEYKTIFLCPAKKTKTKKKKKQNLKATSLIILKWKVVIAFKGRVMNPKMQSRLKLDYY